MQDPAERRWWNLSARAAAGELDVSPAEGLPAAAVAPRRRRHGRNRLRQVRRRRALHILVDQFKSLVVLILAGAALLSFLFGQTVEGIAVSVAVIFNTVIGFFTEWKAVRSMHALRRLSRAEARVLREGRQRTVPAEDLVVGDIVLLEAGDLVSADLRLLEANRLQTDESALTGESDPAAKTTGPAAAETPLAERSCMAFKGTHVTRGSGRGLVTATGMDTELGRISRLVEEAGGGDTPLEERLDQLGRRLIWVTLALAGVIVVLGLVRSKEILLIVESAVALAVAAIPEGLPVVATVALARGMLRMARRNALINRLSSVETLGATEIIFTDKTGTLTENRMHVERVHLPAGLLAVDLAGREKKALFRRDGERLTPAANRDLQELLETAALCNNASLPAGKGAEGREEEERREILGDPLEAALLELADRSGLEFHHLRERKPEEREEPFDPETKMMATFNREEEGWRVSVKGAPDAVLPLCRDAQAGGERRAMDEEERRRWRERNDRLAGEGYRLLALARKRTGDLEEDPYRDLTFQGLVAFRDPPRRNMTWIMETCRRAGIRVIMVTGDQAETARHVADSVKLTGNREPRVLHGPDLEAPGQETPSGDRERRRADCFARVTPEQKLDLIQLHQEGGAVVAMTGDGVNDAPALEKADIGVAMGRRGTQVAREAADMILKDDSLATILAAIEQGRVIFHNIRHFILYLLSGNVSEIMVVAAAIFLDLPLPLLPLQILFLNLVLDVFPALALGVNNGEKGIMRRPPRPPEEPIIGRGRWLWITGYAALIALAVLGSFVAADRLFGLAGTERVTISFLTLAFARLWHVFNLRSGDSHPLRNPVVENPFVWGALALCAAIILAVTFLPLSAGVIGVGPPAPAHWLLILAASLVPLAGGQLLKALGVDRL